MTKLNLQMLHESCSTLQHILHICHAMQVLLLCMLAPKSYTSEDVIELHCHGGGVCVQRVLGCCLKAGARLAKPGEFTLRAFLNGRLDLSQVVCPYLRPRLVYTRNMLLPDWQDKMLLAEPDSFLLLTGDDGRSLHNTSRT